MKVTLLSKTPNIDQVMQEVASITRGSEIDSQKFAEIAYQANHMSCFEHIFLTFKIEGITRACSHQLVRHRLASFLQKSQRHHKAPVSEKDFPGVHPVLAKHIIEEYNRLIFNGKTQDEARMVLPNATLTDLIMTVNLRQFIHMCELRLCKKASDEIQDLFRLLAGEAELPFYLDKYLNPPCQNKRCPELKPCGAL